MGVNRVILVGNVGRDVELKTLPSGTQLATFTMATTEPRFKDQNGEPHTEWHNLVAWGRRAEIVNQIVSKGRLIYVEGHIRRREYEKNGQKTYFTEVHVDDFQLLGSRSGDGGGGGGYSGGEGGGNYSGGGGGGGGDEGPPSFPDDGDDVPF